MSFQIKTILFQQILFFFILSSFLSSLLLQNFEIQSSVQNLQPAHYIRAVLYPEDKNCCIPFCRTYYLSGRQYLSKRQIYIRLTVNVLSIQFLFSSFFKFSVVPHILFSYRKLQVVSGWWRKRMEIKVEQGGVKGLSPSYVRTYDSQLYKGKC